MICPICNRCPFDKGVCEDRLNRGRRFFLMGALALPVARKLEALAPIVAPPMAQIISVRYVESMRVIGPRYPFLGSVWHWTETGV